MSDATISNEAFYQCDCIVLPANRHACIKILRSSVTFDFTTKQKKVEVLSKDIIGCNVINREVYGPVISIHSYPLKKNKIGKKWFREKKIFSFKLKLDKTEIEEKTMQLSNKIWMLIDNLDTTSEESYIRKQRNLLVLVNPHSGKGNALKVYHNTVVTMFKEAHINHKMIKTEYPKHAMEIVKDLDLNDFDGIVVVAGDGLIFEVINGLMERSDWEIAIKTPIGAVPGGSGNALAAAVVYHSTRKHYIDKFSTMSVFEICRGKVSPLDIVSIELQDKNKAPNQDRGKVVYSMLNSVVGLIADIDIESEKLRFMGGDARDIIYAVLRIMSWRKYPATIGYSSGLCTEDNYVSTTPSEESSLHVNAKDKLLQTPLLSEPMPNNWTIESGQYIQIMGSYLSHIAKGKVLYKTSKLSDGDIYLHLIRSSMTRLDILNMWELMENGEGLTAESSAFSDEKQKSVKCKMFRVIPEPKHSEILDIDGEKIDFTSYQCQIHQGLANVFTSFFSA